MCSLNAWLPVRISGLGSATDTSSILDRALTILEDWAGGATFDPSGIERQRPIVLSEWRMNLGADERTADKVRRVQLEGSRYVDRSPIGTPEIIQRATREQLTRFYRDWYRPDLMAVIVVGDVDRNAVARMIAQHFQPLTNPSPERPRPVFDVPEHPGTRFAVATDKETTATAVLVSTLRPARNQGSVGGYRQIMKDQLFGDMLSARLDELTQSENIMERYQDGTLPDHELTHAARADMMTLLVRTNPDQQSGQMSQRFNAQIPQAPVAA